MFKVNRCFRRYIEENLGKQKVNTRKWENKEKIRIAIRT